MQEFLASLQHHDHGGELFSSDSIDEVLGQNPDIYSIDALLDVLKNPKPAPNSPNNHSHNQSKAQPASLNELEEIKE